MRQENKALADQAEKLRLLMEQMVRLLPDDAFSDLWERVNEADILLKKVTSELGEEIPDNGFILY